MRDNRFSDFRSKKCIRASEQGHVRVMAARARRNKRAVLEQLEGRALFSAVGFLPAVQAPAGTGPVNIARGDFNGDGKSDVVTANYGGSSLSVELSSPFPPGPCINTSLPFRPIAVVAGDFNGDGKADVVVISQTTAQ